VTLYGKTNGRLLKQQIWLAIDMDSGETVGVYVGSGDREGAKCLWDSLPGVYCQCAVGFTDFQSAYEAISPSERHEAVVKDSGKTNHIERFNLTSIKSGRQNDKNHAKAK
jgi:IS1 family transposase